jgi:hypothetical protein
MTSAPTARTERLRTAYFYDGIEFGYRLLKELARPF